MTLLAVGLDTRQGSPAAFTGLPERIDAVADLLTIEDGFADATGDGPDATLLANWLGARTARAGIMPGVPVNFLEPFHVSTAIATLDFVTQGRAGLLAQPLRGTRAEDARRALGPINGFPTADPDSLAGDLADAVEVIRLLWDSWEDDAVIRDTVSQRFVNGAKLHYVGFKGARFDVLGPSITPRPPQGQPVVAASLQAGEDLAASAGADLVFLGVPEEDAIRTFTASRHAADGGPLVFADVLVSFGRRAEADRPALCWTGDAAGLPGQAREWSRTLGVAGLRFHPASLDDDLVPLLASVLPALGRGAARGAGTLRARLGLPPAPNRYAPAASAA